LYDLVIKDVTVKQLKQVTLNVVDVDKINIVTSQVHKLYSKCPPLAWTHARCLPHHWSTASSKIDCLRPHQTSTSRRFSSSTLWICLW